MGNNLFFIIFYSYKQNDEWRKKISRHLVIMVTEVSLVSSRKYAYTVVRDFYG